MVSFEVVLLPETVDVWTKRYDVWAFDKVLRDDDR